MKNKLSNFFNVLFKSYGQIFFCNSVLFGFLFFIATFYNPVMALTGLIGACIANITGLFFYSEESPYLKAGLFGCNGILTGLAWGHYISINPVSIAILIVLSIFCSILTVILIDMFARKYDLPVLSLAFVVSTLIGILAITGFNSDIIKVTHSSYTIESLLNIEKILDSLFPMQFKTFLKVLGSTFFLGNLFTGVIFFLCILFYSRILAMFALIGYLVSAILSYGVFGHSSKILETSIGFNCILISLVFGGLFVVLNIRSFIYALLAISIGFFIGSSVNLCLKFFNLPVLALPFNITTLLFLYPLKTGFLDTVKTGLYQVPLVHIMKPEESSIWFKKKRLLEDSQKVVLSLPFYGMWFVSQGNKSTPTHKDLGKYAWDFIVVDTDKKQFSGSGVKNENYFCYGLPVLAPADGKVVKVVNNVLDNEPGDTNEEENWGNCIIIDHSNNEFSEISHFKENSIVVKEGETVVRGQLLGFCGNSGLSPEPHIHYQLQRGKDLSAQTISANFTNFAKNKDGFKFVKSGIPQEGDIVCNHEIE
ncbi:MAG: urea transporter [Candidatus Firestonebacteria bacterium]